jgi:hypothetical protein
MNRDIKTIQRNLEDKKNNDIIYKKNKLLEMLKADPDLIEVLNRHPKRPLNQYADKNNPTQEELDLRNEILDYNERVTHEQIIPYLKVLGLQKEVSNFIMFDIRDDSVSSYNNIIKNQELWIMCLVHEDDMDTEYGITRMDLLDYIIKDLLCWTNRLGMQLKCTSDYPDILDQKYYCRTIKFEIYELNNIYNNRGSNKYDKR